MGQTPIRDYWTNILKTLLLIIINTNMLPISIFLGIFSVPEVIQRFMLGLQLLPPEAQYWKNVINPGLIYSKYYDIEINHSNQYIYLNPRGINSHNQTVIFLHGLGEPSAQYL